jgi:hypothetical protein
MAGVSIKFKTMAVIARADLRANGGGSPKGRNDE